MSIRDRKFVIHNASVRYSQRPIVERSDTFDQEVPAHVLAAQRRHSKTRPGTLASAHYSSRPTITAEFAQRPQDASSDWLRVKQERARKRAITSKGGGRFANSASSLN